MDVWQKPPFLEVSLPNKVFRIRKQANSKYHKVIITDDANLTFVFHMYKAMTVIVVDNMEISSLISEVHVLLNDLKKTCKSQKLIIIFNCGYSSLLTRYNFSQEVRNNSGDCCSYCDFYLTSNYTEDLFENMLKLKETIMAEIPSCYFIPISLPPFPINWHWITFLAQHENCCKHLQTVDVINKKQMNIMQNGLNDKVTSFNKSINTYCTAENLPTVKWSITYLTNTDLKERQGKIIKKVNSVLCDVIHKICEEECQKEVSCIQDALSDDDEEIVVKEEPMESDDYDENVSTDASENITSPAFDLHSETNGTLYETAPLVGPEPTHLDVETKTSVCKSGPSVVSIPSTSTMSDPVPGTSKDSACDVDIQVSSASFTHPESVKEKNVIFETINSPKVKNGVCERSNSTGDEDILLINSEIDCCTDISKQMPKRKRISSAGSDIQILEDSIHGLGSIGSDVICISKKRETDHAVRKTGKNHKDESGDLLVLEEKQSSKKTRSKYVMKTCFVDLEMDLKSSASNTNVQISSKRKVKSTGSSNPNGDCAMESSHELDISAIEKKLPDMDDAMEDVPNEENQELSVSKMEEEHLVEIKEEKKDENDFDVPNFVPVDRERIKMSKKQRKTLKSEGKSAMESIIAANKDKEEELPEADVSVFKRTNQEGDTLNIIITDERLKRVSQILSSDSTYQNYVHICGQDSTIHQMTNAIEEALVDIKKLKYNQKKQLIVAICLGSVDIVTLATSGKKDVAGEAQAKMDFKYLPDQLADVVFNRIKELKTAIYVFDNSACVLIFKLCFTSHGGYIKSLFEKVNERIHIENKNDVRVKKCTEQSVRHLRLIRGAQYELSVTDTVSWLETCKYMFDIIAASSEKFKCKQHKTVKMLHRASGDKTSKSSGSVSETNVFSLKEPSLDVGMIQNKNQNTTSNDITQLVAYTPCIKVENIETPPPIPDDQFINRRHNIVCNGSESALTQSEPILDDPIEAKIHSYVAAFKGTSLNYRHVTNLFDSVCALLALDKTTNTETEGDDIKLLKIAQKFYHHMTNQRTGCPKMEPKETLAVIHAVGRAIEHLEGESVKQVTGDLMHAAIMNLNTAMAGEGSSQR